MFEITIQESLKSNKSLKNVINAIRLPHMFPETLFDTSNETLDYIPLYKNTNDDSTVDNRHCTKFGPK